MGILHKDNKNKIQKMEEPNKYNCRVMVMVVPEWILCMKDSGSKEICLTQCVSKAKQDRGYCGPWVY